MCVYKQDLALDNPQVLICSKTQPNKSILYAKKKKKGDMIYVIENKISNPISNPGGGFFAFRFRLMPLGKGMNPFVLYLDIRKIVGQTEKGMLKCPQPDQEENTLISCNVYGISILQLKTFCNLFFLTFFNSSKIKIKIKNISFLVNLGSFHHFLIDTSCWSNLYKTTRNKFPPYFQRSIQRHFTHFKWPLQNQIFRNVSKDILTSTKQPGLKKNF